MSIAISSFFLGLLATTSPCVLPLFPGFLVYLNGLSETDLGKKRYFLGLFVLAGVLFMMLTLGGLIAILAVPVGKVLVFALPLADIVIFTMGILLLADKNPFNYLPQIQIPALRNPFLNAYVYGLLYGPIALPCSGPLVVGIFALSLNFRDALSKLWVFLWFGLGFGIPLLLISLLSGILQLQITRFFAHHSRMINLLGGLLLVTISIFDMVKNWDLILIFFT